MRSIQYSRGSGRGVTLLSPGRVRKPTPAPLASSTVAFIAQQFDGLLAMHRRDHEAIVVRGERRESNRSPPPPPRCSRLRPALFATSLAGMSPTVTARRCMRTACCFLRA